MPTYPQPSLLGRLAIVFSAALLVTACVPDLRQEVLREPETPVPASFGAATDAADTEPDSAASSVPTANVQWREFFKDPKLAALIETALDGNQELNIRVQEIVVAQNEIMARTGEYLPKVDVGVGTGVEKVGLITSQGASDEANGVPEVLRNYRLGFSASWEVDVWKRLRNSARAATFEYLASVEGRNFMVTRVVAEIANTYYELMALDRQLEVLRQNIGLQQDALEIVRLEKQAAVVTELAVQRFEAEVLKNRSRQFDLEQRIVETQNRLNFLVGRYPGPIPRDGQGLGDPMPALVRTGVPSELLGNRPDVKQAELQLAAAKLDVQVARARFYPSLSIEAGVGYESYQADELLSTPDSVFYGLAGGIVAPLVNRRAIKAEYFSKGAEQLKAVLQFEQTLLMAFTEVANQLSMIDNLQKSYDLQAQQVSVLGQAIEVSNTLFRSARADYMEVLLTRRDSLDAQMELIDTQLAQKRAMVNVYQALGGGWQ
ncbi:Outer membrane protein OprM precursor [Planctomycetes bacterium Poly30]|uniref:Outer membrane protein OprM n=1 Tax=Saltatorellus ferox TaxID=2528018 RepID=A0A518EVB4_9BACT|nr:Outer membrane protein OprM precursor [Planctomycetes bacterium Poly30]